MHFAIEIGPLRLQITSEPQAAFPMDRFARLAGWCLEYALQHPYEAKKLWNDYSPTARLLAAKFIMEATE